MGRNLKIVRRSEEREAEKLLDEDISIHIFSTSATMVGVCLTVIGLFKVVFQLKATSTIGDDLLFFDALLFLLACALSYWALRTRSKRRRHLVEKAADTAFLAGLSLMAVTCAFIVYALV